MASHLDSTLGAAFIGMVVAAVLYGVSCVQAWYYYTYQNDRWPTILLVTVVMLFDTIHQVLITHVVYTYTVTHWGSPAELQKLVWSLSVQVIFTGFTTVLVQSFLALRVWRLKLLANKSRIFLISVIASLVIGEFVCAVVNAIETLHLKTFPELAKTKALPILVVVLAAAGDVLIAVTLCTMLHLSRTGFKRSDTMIDKLILFAVSTGALTSLCALASLIFLFVGWNTYIYIAFYFCVGRLYANSLLATLNGRDTIKTAVQGIQTTTEELSMSSQGFQKHVPITTTASTSIEIRIDTTKEHATDSGHQLNFEKSESTTNSSKHSIRQ